MEKPDIDSIEGICPAIAIRQKNSIRNPRSTVGTTTEIHDYLRLLYARVGRTFCRNCGKEVIRETAEVVAARLTALPRAPPAARVRHAGVARRRWPRRAGPDDEERSTTAEADARAAAVPARSRRFGRRNLAPFGARASAAVRRRATNLDEWAARRWGPPCCRSSSIA
jgi:hypothetical protein